MKTAACPACDWRETTDDVAWAERKLTEHARSEHRTTKAELRRAGRKKPSQTQECEHE